MTPTCVAPRHVDAPRDFFYLFFSPNEQRVGGGRGGGGGALPDFPSSFFPCSADHERGLPPCKVVFLVLATNALNVRNNSYNSRSHKIEKKTKKYGFGPFLYKCFVPIRVGLTYEIPLISSPASMYLLRA